jgi:hypothetical protein
MGAVEDTGVVASDDFETSSFFFIGIDSFGFTEFVESETRSFFSDSFDAVSTRTKLNNSTGMITNAAIIGAGEEALGFSIKLSLYVSTFSGTLVDCGLILGAWSGFELFDLALNR